MKLKRLILVGRQRLHLGVLISQSSKTLIEEVGRIYGYDNIPNQAPKAALKMNDHKEANQPLKRVRDLLVDRGYHEAITYSFVEPEQQKLVTWC